MTSLLSVFDERSKEFEVRKQTNYQYVDTFWSALTGSGFQKISETYDSMLRRPDLFPGKTGLNLFYAIYIGNSYSRDSLYIMFQNYLSKSPSSKNSGVIFNWAKMIRERQMSLAYEPVLSKLNNVLNTWMNSGRYVTINGNKYVFDTFKPVFYNSEGESLSELVPYIGYLFTFLIYGFPYQFNDEYSESSMKSYYSSLEDWFDTCYETLYKEQGVTPINAKEIEISDNTWRGFFNSMLNEGKIIELRNLEMNKTDDLLSAQTSTQLSIQDEDLAKKFELVLVEMIKYANSQAPWEKIILQFEPFLNSYMDSAEVIHITEWMICGAKSNYAIDPHDSFRYLRTNEDIGNVFKSEKVPFKLNVDLSSISLKEPFIKSNFALDGFCGYLNERLIARRNELDEARRIYINIEDMKAREIYPFILNFFCNGIWRTQSKEMSIFMKQISNKNSFIDFFGIRNVCEIFHGNTTGSILAPVYAVSLLDLWMYSHLENSREIREFNPFKYLRWSVSEFDGGRIKKLTAILYSCCFLKNEKYLEFVREEAVRFIELVQSAYGYLQPYIRSLADDAEKWALVGLDGYRYAKFANPIVRGYGFYSNAFGVNERSYLIFRLLELNNNETLFQLVESNVNNKQVIGETLKMAIEQIDLENLPKLLSRFTIRANGSYLLKTTREIINESSIEIFKLLKYSFKRSSPGLMLDNDEIMVKNMVEPGKKASLNGYSYGSRYINFILSREGKQFLLPKYGVVGEMEEATTSTVIPDGLRVEPIYTISAVDGTKDNCTYWILTKMEKPSQFDAYARPSIFMPDDGAYGLTDRIQQYPKY